MTDNAECGTEDGTPDYFASDGGQRADEILTALADARRRYVLYYLRDEKQASLAEIAKQIVAWEREASVDTVSDKTPEKIKVQLYHSHLPKLREASIVEYDDRSKQLVLRDSPELVELCLDHCAEHDLPV